MISEILVAVFLIFNPTIITIHPQPDAFNTSSIKDLEAFLEWSKVNDTVYNIDSYNCVNFTDDLIKELEYYGFETGNIRLSSIGDVNGSHKLSYTVVNNNLMFIEPQTDDIFVFNRLNEYYNNKFDYVQINYLDNFNTYYYIKFGEPLFINQTGAEL